jgi:hypothetical protein
MITKEEIIHFVMEKYPGLVVNKNWGETGLFYNPEGKLKKGIYLLTFKEKDGKHDSSSRLDREEKYYRLNLGVSKKTFIEFFGFIPSRPVAGKIVDMKYDFSSINTIMPHPIYSWMGWVCVINPTRKTFDSMQALIDEAYQLCLKKYKKKKQIL